MGFLSALTKREKTLTALAAFFTSLLAVGAIVAYLNGCASKSFSQQIEATHAASFSVWHKPITDSITKVQTRIDSIEQRQLGQMKINRQIVYLILAPYSDEQQIDIQKRADQKWHADSTRAAMRGR